MSKSPDKFEADLWLLFSQSTEIEGQWIAHCLNFDIVTQGKSLKDAYEMACEAIEMTVRDDLEAGRDPRDRKTTPKEDWDLLDCLIKTGHRVMGLKQVPTDRKGLVVAIPVKIKAERVVEEEPKLLPAWMANQLMNQQGTSVDC